MKNIDKDLDFEYKNEKKLKKFKTTIFTKFYKNYSKKQHFLKKQLIIN